MQFRTTFRSIPSLKRTPHLNVVGGAKERAAPFSSIHGPFAFAPFYVGVPG